MQIVQLQKMGAAQTNLRPHLGPKAKAAIAPDLNLVAVQTAKRPPVVRHLMAVPKFLAKFVACLNLLEVRAGKT